MNTETEKKRRTIKYSVQFKFVLLFFLLLIMLLGLLNTYPVIILRDLVFKSKENTLQNQASLIASALAPTQILTEESVHESMKVLDIMAFSRVVITDGSGVVLYDTSLDENTIGSNTEFPEIDKALKKKSVLNMSFDGTAFISSSAMPVRSNGVTIGSVYLYEYDEEQASMITGIQLNMRTMSLTVGALACAVIIILTRAMTLRITELVRAVRIVTDGDYQYRLQTRGNDEITELGQEFNNMTERLQNTEELRRRFVSDASHELKTPLASIRLLADSITQSDNMDADTLNEFVSDIGNETERLQRTTDKLLNLARIDDGDREILDQRCVDMKKVVENTLRLLSPLAVSRNITLKHKLEEECYIFGSEDDIYQVIFNLAENGIKYNLPNGEVRMLLYKSKSEVTLIVDDTGIGIPSEDAPHIFSRFYRVDKARSREAGGSGLGLSIVRDVVRLHSGTVAVEPRKTEGTRFTVVFPRYFVEYNDETNQEGLTAE